MLNFALGLIRVFGNYSAGSVGIYRIVNSYWFLSWKKADGESCVRLGFETDKGSGVGTSCD
jgi:hypothetical protein